MQNATVLFIMYVKSWIQGSRSQRFDEEKSVWVGDDMADNFNHKIYYIQTGVEGPSCPYEHIKGFVYNIVTANCRYNDVKCNAMLHAPGKLQR